MRIALCQLAATSDPEINLALVADGIEAARRAGARVVVFPEATQARFGTPLAEVAQPLDGPWACEVRRQARRAGMVAVVGMFTPAADGRVHNTLLVTGPYLETHYDKIHLFDALGHAESRVVAPGGRLVVIELPADDGDGSADPVRLGLATCYDVRFPRLFTALARAGAAAVLLPASWGAGAGKAEQWELLVRARALDATTWVLACDQADPAAAGLSALPGAPGGIGLSMAVTPRGQVAARLGATPGQLVVDVDPAMAAEARQALPVLAHASALASGIDHEVDVVRDERPRPAG